MKTIHEMVFSENWGEIASKFSVKEVCSLLSFSEAMHVVKHLFYDDIRDDAKEQYALKLALEIRDCFKQEWDSDWKNEAFLGGLYEMLCFYDERYLCYKRAYDSLEDPPGELLLCLANCNSAPGTPPITDEQAEYYLKKALNKKITIETALQMRSLSCFKKNEAQEKYWDQMYEKLKKENVHAEQIIPDVLKQ